MSDLNKIVKGALKSNIAANFQNVSPIETLPPIGVFWDIENCQVPKGKSAIALVQSIRHRFFEGYREAEFMCVCDISKERKEIIQELNLAQVTVVHINATSKNAADDKLKQCMRRFVDIHGSPATILLVSGDVNFATDLSDFRHRHNIHVILLHGNHAPEPLLTCAHESHSFSEITNYLPYRSPAKGQNRTCELTVSDLPSNRDTKQIQNRLRQLSDNCGGKVISVIGNTAVLKFPSADAAQRARKRMDREDVFGSKISVTFSQRSSVTEGPESSQLKLGSTRGFKGGRQSTFSSGSSRESSPGPLKEADLNSGLVQHYQSKPFDFPPPPDLVLQNQKDKHKQERELNDFSLQFISQNSSSSIALDYDSRDDEKHTLRNRRTWSTSSSTPQSSDQSKSRDPSPFTRSDGEDTVKPHKSNQKNIGRVSPFLMSEGSTKHTWPSNTYNDSQSLCHRDVALSDNFGNNSSICPVHFHATPSCSSFFSISRSTETNPAYVLPWSTSLTYPCDSTSYSSRGSPVIPSSPVELLVTNLDQSFEVNEMKKILLSVFREHVMVLHITMVLQPDASLKALVKVPSLQDAQYAISQLHRRKIGYKRILISYASCEKSPPLHVLRSEVVALLSDVPTKRLPVFKFRELFEKRYHRTISVSDLHKMRDAVIIQEESTGRIVCLNLDYRNTPSPADSDSSQEVQQILEKPYCEQHFHISESQGWAEQDSVYPLPDVDISLKTLAPRVHTLLDSHQGSLPLNSFCSCYKAEFGSLPIVRHAVSDEFFMSSGEKNPDTDGSSCSDKDTNSEIQGVPLEHLVACIPGVQITKSTLGIKKVQWLENKPLDIEGARSISPALAGQLSLFSRELFDLLKNQPHCSIPFNKFIPTYHHHFGRQCRVADYGFTKLIDLLDAVPHIVQILGQGHNRLLILTHRSQIKRFAADLLRILKSRASKQITLSELATVYEQVIGKPFNIADYGVCDPEDMLSEISDNTVVISSMEGEISIAIPKREQTSEEIEKTKEFAIEVIELLRHTPNCSMEFTKFIPSYHHHYGKQCKVSDYGFTKLVELFEAIPECLEVYGTGEDKILKLTEQEQNKVIAERFVAVVRSSPQQVVCLDQLSAAYTKLHGHALKVQEFGASDLPDLLNKFKSSLKIVDGLSGSVLTLVDRGFVQQTSLKIRRLLMEKADGNMTTDELWRKYLKRFGHSININTICQDLSDMIEVENNFVKLKPVQVFARDLLTLMHEHDGHMPLQNFETSFLKRFGLPCRPAQYGFPSVVALLQSLPEYVILRGRRSKRMITLNRENAGSPLPMNSSKCKNLGDGKGNSSGGTHEKKRKKSGNSENQKKTSVSGMLFGQPERNEQELLYIRNSPVDLLNQPIPSGVPSPDLEPQSNMFSEKDLMGFESPLPSAKDVIAAVSGSYLVASKSRHTPAVQEAQDNANSILKYLISGSNTFHHSTECSNITRSANSTLSDSFQSYMGFQQPSVAYIMPNHPYISYNTVHGRTDMNNTGMVTASSSNLILASTPMVSVHGLPSVASAIIPSQCQSVEKILCPNLQNMTIPTCISSSTSPAASQTIDQKMRPDSISCEDLTVVGNKSFDSLDGRFPSTQSTPTRISGRTRTRSRIAAQFSVPIHPSN